MSDLTRLSASPFDEIRRVRPDGSEYWSARDLQPLLGYSAWQNMAVPIQRAMKSADNQKMDVTSQFMESHNLVNLPQGGTSRREDYELTRWAAYLVAMNGDPNKEEVADAQGYFAAKTRQAEVARPDLSTLDGIRALCDQLEAAERNAAQAKQIAARTDARLDAIEGRHEWYAALGYARLIGFPDTSSQTLAKIGYMATQIARSSEPPVTAHKVSHALFGRVNSYPAWVWDMAFTDYAADM